MKKQYALLLFLFLGIWLSITADEQKVSQKLQAMDVFALEYVSDPQISPDGQWVIYTRNSFDKMQDASRSQLWMVKTDGSQHQPFSNQPGSSFGARWSPDSKAVLYSYSHGETVQLYVKWLETGKIHQLTRATHAPQGASWSPDGQSIAFLRFVPKPSEHEVSLPSPPAGAKWAESPEFIDHFIYRFDGKGYVKKGSHQIFIVPIEGGMPRQLTSHETEHEAPLSWSNDGKQIVCTANYHEDSKQDPVNSELYMVSLQDGSVKALTTRQGPDYGGILAPNGKQIAYLGFDDQKRSHHLTNLYLMDLQSQEVQNLSAKLDRSVRQPAWDQKGEGIYFLYDNEGKTQLGYLSLANRTILTVIDDVGGMSLGRPYSSGQFSVNQGKIAYTQNCADRPADLAVVTKSGDLEKTLTRLNEDLLAYRQLATIEEIWFPSSYDERKIQGWLVKPPHFDPNNKYPLILEIHGGPFANYGSYFSAEVQLYAAAGYVVLYINPRGSTGYGQEFAGLIHHNYPGEDYDDLMSGVDFVTQREYVDQDNLFVTGGSGGGILTAWIVGKTDRFRAAVVAKPVINWYSFALTTDAYNYFYQYWFEGTPWEQTEAYMERSPLSLMNNVTTPTMLLSGVQDYRTPISEAEQFYQALKLREVDTAFVRFPEASHYIAARPSYLIAKVAYILSWFDKYQTDSPKQQK